MLCSICNRVPTDPVVARTTGCLFERSLVEKYIAETGRCPITGEPLTTEDLIAVRPSVASPTAGATAGLAAASVPGLLERMRAEWDGVMLEQFSLRQQLAQQQQELAHALQQYEAACRVIARMAKDQEVLRMHQGQNGAEEEAGLGALAAASMPAKLSACIDKAEADQHGQRKQRSGREMRTAKLSADSQLFPVMDSEGGAVCLAVLGGGGRGDATILSAGLVSPRILQYSLGDRKAIAAGTGHTKAIHTITATQDAQRIVTASEDATVRVWKAFTSSQPFSSLGSLTCEHTLRYASGVSALSRRTIDNQYAFCGSRTGAVYVSDIARGEHVMVSEVHGEEEGEEGEEEEEEALQQYAVKRRRTRQQHHKPHAITALELHPYTKLGAIGTEGGELFVWNVKEEVVDTAIALPKGKGSGGAAAVCSLDFSLDCVTLAAGLSNGDALVWDLRKAEEPLVSVSGTAANRPALVAFDAVSGSVLAVGSGSGVRVGKPMELASARDGLSLSMKDGKVVRGVAWGPSYLAAMSVDGVVEVFGEY